MINALSVDVEDWYQAIETIPQSDWEKYEDRIVQNTNRVLNIFEEYNQKATFFILGCIAEKHPELVKGIAEMGHEVATHGYSHTFVYRFSQNEFREDLLRSIEVIEPVLNLVQEKESQKKVLGHRATAWTITKETLWAIDILKDCGLKYDSSIFPIKTYLYGIPEAERFPYMIRKDFYEFPASTIRICGKNFPLAGGFFFRLYPYQVIKFGIKILNNANKPALVYIHPWDLDTKQPRVSGLPLKVRRHYLNLDKTEGKLRRLLSDFKFAPIREILPI